MPHDICTCKHSPVEVQCVYRWGKDVFVCGQITEKLVCKDFKYNDAMRSLLRSLRWCSCTVLRNVMHTFICHFSVSGNKIILALGQSQLWSHWYSCLLVGDWHFLVCVCILFIVVCAQVMPAIRPKIQLIKGRRQVCRAGAKLRKKRKKYEPFLSLISTGSVRSPVEKLGVQTRIQQEYMFHQDMVARTMLKPILLQSLLMTDGVILDMSLRGNVSAPLMLNCWLRVSFHDVC